MRFVIFTHSLVSDWNHGNAHFLRGITTELIIRGNHVRVFEPKDGWSREHLMQECEPSAPHDFAHFYPLLESSLYDIHDLDLNNVLRDADVVIVHEWNPPSLIARIGEHRCRHGNYVLFFHDTHHRMVTDAGAMANYDLSKFDGVLAYGDVIRDAYIARGLATAAWTWHEAADTRVFRPQPVAETEGDLVWIGNWGDDERTEELNEFLFEPVKRLKLRARVYGVRYPAQALSKLAEANIEYGGWLPNYKVPEVFARFRMTVHVPRRPYADSLPGIPTIRPFEALACGIPMVSAPWEDSGGLFRAGKDYLVAKDGEEMVTQIQQLLSNALLCASLSASGMETIVSRHTCAHRVDELLQICSEVLGSVPAGRHA
jgi:spore maturation protein CgeB